MSDMYVEHKPVLLNEAIDTLNIKENGIYVDATLGGGGYAEKILQKLNASGRLIAIDCDQEALENFKQKHGNYQNIILVKGNFGNIAKILEENEVGKIDGIVFDLGVSTHQFIEKSRGFSFTGSNELDMRMDREQDITAKHLVNNLSAFELEKIFSEFGEEKFSRRIARQITRARSEKEINTTDELVKIISDCVPLKFKNQKIHFATRVFQALRIAVNNELENLKKALEESVNFLKAEGRITVVAYHSLEDRIVKNVFREMTGPCKCSKKLPACVCGAKTVLKILTRKPVTPSEEEVKLNPKSRSAKLRSAEKI